MIGSLNIVLSDAAISKHIIGHNEPNEMKDSIRHES